MSETGFQGSNGANISGYYERQQSIQSEAPIIAKHNASADWIPDGVIGENEYARSIVLAGKKRDHLTGRNLEVYWKNDAQNFYMALKGRTKGWIAIGFEPSLAMKDADIITSTVNGSNVTVLDEYCTGNYGPHMPDTELGGSNDILEYGGKYDGNFTVIEFKRKMNTEDKFDKAFIPGQNVSIIWAMADSDSLTSIHDGAQGKGEISWK